MKTFIILLFTFLTLCCSKIQDNFEKEIYAKKIITHLERVKYSENLEPNGGIDFEIGNSTYFVEVLEEMISKEKIIDHTQSLYEKSNRYDKTYSFFNDNKNVTKLVIITNSIFFKEKNIHKELKDSIFYKNNKLYFWKNKNPSKQEILAKEKEILAIKREIDSVLSE